LAQDRNPHARIPIARRPLKGRFAPSSAQDRNPHARIPIAQRPLKGRSVRKGTALGACVAARDKVAATLTERQEKPKKKGRR
jgi:hypothetical protein